jgi:2-oxoglutarate ferredoxin oxidoreductase subunit gamma
MKGAYQLILAGEGGQGLLVAGHILARAAILEGKNVVQSKSYGIQARGGYSEAQIIISDTDIHYPKCDEPDLVLALTQKAYDRYAGSAGGGCLIIYEKDGIAPLGNKNETGFPFRGTCLELGEPRAINVLFLGVILKNVPVVKKESLIRAVKEVLPPKIHAINLKALAAGMGEAG